MICTTCSLAPASAKYDSNRSYNQKWNPILESTGFQKRAFAKSKKKIWKISRCLSSLNEGRFISDLLVQDENDLRNVSNPGPEPVLELLECFNQLSLQSKYDTFAQGRCGGGDVTIAD